ncbi:MAG: MBL fold metallo-hydrolase [Pseudomonadota bacterium]
MQITVLIEDSINNEASDNDALINEFGLSLYIESNGVALLLDAGSSGSFIQNSQTLGIDLKTLDLAVISHAHFDHGGGLNALFEYNFQVPVYLHAEAAKDYYANIGARLPMAINRFVHPLVRHSRIVSRYIGLDQNLMKEYAARIKHVTESVQIGKNIFVITNISKTHPMPEGNRFLLTGSDGSLVPDQFVHEIILAIREEDGIVLFSGCCHSGILNMIQTARHFFNDEPIKSIVGGFHLKLQPMKEKMAGTQEDIDYIANELLALNIGHIYTGHCTGSQAYQALKTSLKERLHPLYTGAVIHV